MASPNPNLTVALALGNRGAAAGGAKAKYSQEYIRWKHPKEHNQEKAAFSVISSQ